MISFPTQPGLHPVVQAEMQRRIESEGTRLERIARAWKYYNGDAPKPLTVSRRKGAADDNVRVNYARLIVNTSVFYLFGRDLGIDLDEDARIPEEDWLDEALPNDERMLLFQKLATNGGVTGHTFARILLPEPGEPFPRVIALDPGIVTPTWDPRDIDRVLRWKIEFSGDDPEDGKPRRFKTTIEPSDPKRPTSWTMTDFEAEPQGSWTQVDQATWPYPFAPIVHAQNLPAANEFWGVPDLEADILDLGSNVDRALSNLNKIVRLYTKPPTFAWGVTGEQLKELNANPDGFNVMPNPNGKIESLKTEAELASAIDFKRELVAALHEIANIPEVATGKLDGVGQLSSLALNILFAPLISLTETKRRTYGMMVREIVRRVLIIGGQADQLPVLTWPAIVPTDPLADAQVAVIDEELGASKDTLLAKRGYDPEKEKAKKASEQTNLGRNLLDNLADGTPQPPEPQTGQPAGA